MRGIENFLVEVEVVFLFQKCSLRVYRIDFYLINYRFKKEHRREDIISVLELFTLGPGMLGKAVPFFYRFKPGLHAIDPGLTKFLKEANRIGRLLGDLGDGCSRLWSILNQRSHFPFQVLILSGANSWVLPTKIGIIGPWGKLLPNLRNHQGFTLKKAYLERLGTTI